MQILQNLNFTSAEDMEVLFIWKHMLCVFWLVYTASCGVFEGTTPEKQDVSQTVTDNKGFDITGLLNGALNFLGSEGGMSIIEALGGLIASPGYELAKLSMSDLLDLIEMELDGNKTFVNLTFVVKNVQVPANKPNLDGSLGVNPLCMLPIIGQVICTLENAVVMTGPDGSGKINHRYGYKSSGAATFEDNKGDKEYVEQWNLTRSYMILSKGCNMVPTYDFNGQLAGNVSSNGSTTAWGAPSMQPTGKTTVHITCDGMQSPLSLDIDGAPQVCEVDYRNNPNGNLLLEQPWFQKMLATDGEKPVFSIAYGGNPVLHGCVNSTWDETDPDACPAARAQAEEKGNILECNKTTPSHHIPVIPIESLYKPYLMSISYHQNLTLTFLDETSHGTLKGWPERTNCIGYWGHTNPKSYCQCCVHMGPCEALEGYQNSNSMRLLSRQWLYTGNCSQTTPPHQNIDGYLLPACFSESNPPTDSGCHCQYTKQCDTAGMTDGTNCTCSGQNCHRTMNCSDWTGISYTNPARVPLYGMAFKDLVTLPVIFNLSEAEQQVFNFSHQIPGIYSICASDHLKKIYYDKRDASYVPEGDKCLLFPKLKSEYSVPSEETAYTLSFLACPQAGYVPSLTYTTDSIELKCSKAPKASTGQVLPCWTDFDNDAKLHCGYDITAIPANYTHTAPDQIWQALMYEVNRIKQYVAAHPTQRKLVPL